MLRGLYGLQGAPRRRKMVSTFTPEVASGQPGAHPVQEPKLSMINCILFILFFPPGTLSLLVKSGLNAPNWCVPVGENGQKTE